MAISIGIWLLLCTDEFFHPCMQCLLDISIIGGLLYTTYRYGTNSAQLLAAGKWMVRV